MTPPSPVGRELARGAAPLAVLHLLARRPMYGYELATTLARESDGVLELGHSTLYPILYNLERKGLVRSEERSSESGRPRRYYLLTAKGERWMAAQRDRWQALERGMRALGLADGTA